MICLRYKFLFCYYFYQFCLQHFLNPVTTSPIFTGGSSTSKWTRRKLSTSTCFFLFLFFFWWWWLLLLLLLFPLKKFIKCSGAGEGKKWLGIWFEWLVRNSGVTSFHENNCQGNQPVNNLWSLKWAAPLSLSLGPKAPCESFSVQGRTDSEFAWVDQGPHLWRSKGNKK